MLAFTLPARGVEDDEEGDYDVLDGEEEVFAVGGEGEGVADAVGEGYAVGEGFEDVGGEGEAARGGGVYDYEGVGLV